MRPSCGVTQSRCSQAALREPAGDGHGDGAASDATGAAARGCGWRDDGSRARAAP